MAYYVIYDNKDNIIAYIDTIDELVTYTNCRKKQLVYDLKRKDVVQFLCNCHYYKIFKFVI